MTQDPQTQPTAANPTSVNKHRFEKNPNLSVPSEVAGWNWGAFVFTWIWGIGNNVWISLLVFVPCIGFIWAFVLGAKGNEWAWQHRKFESVEQFRKVQRIWMMWALIVIVSLLAVASIFITIGYYLIGNINY